MDYKRYQNARDASWETLIYCKAEELPIDVRAVCQALGCKLYTYTIGAELIKAFGLFMYVDTTDGFTTFYRGTPYIFYSDQTTEARQRFTIAHEIGHIVLKHFGSGQGTTINHEQASQDAPEEMQANQFAARLLAPACILHALNTNDAKEVAALCNISMQAAVFRTARMQTLNARKKFLSHPLERLVYKQFQPFIMSRSEFHE